MEHALTEYQDAVILFSAHSLPVINRGDPYPAEVAATVDAVMPRTQIPLQTMLAGRTQTSDIIQGFAKKSQKNLVPIASEHIETLSWT
jgi:ferrochelatase